MSIPDNSIKYIKIGEKQIAITNNGNDVDLKNLHVVEFFDFFTDSYDKNKDFKISTKSYSSIFLNDIKELIGDDDKITDDEIKAYITKNFGFYSVDDVKKALVDIFSTKNTSLFKKTKTPDGDNINSKFRVIKIGDKKIYVGDELTGDIDVSKYCTKGYCDNAFLAQFINSNTLKIDSGVEAEALYELINNLSDENNEISDEAISDYIKKTPHLADCHPAWIREFLIQAFPEPKTDKEKEMYFAANEERIDKISNTNNLLHQATNDELVLVCKEIVQDFRNEFGIPDSPSKRVLIEKEYYQRDPGKDEAIRIIRNSSIESLAENVKKYGVANCQEDAALTIDLLNKKYPEIKPIEIFFSTQDALGDAGHVAVLVVPQGLETNFANAYLVDNLDENSSLEKFQSGYVIDNWFGGVYKADDWIKMQKHLHKSENVTIATHMDNY